MDDGLKQRLVGAVVLAAVAVIFLPGLFDEDNRRRVDTNTRIPPAKTLKKTEFKAPIRSSASTSEAKAPDEMYQLVEDEPAETDSAAEITKPEPDKKSDAGSQKTTTAVAVSKTPKPSLNSQGVPNAWVVQVASFKTETRASTLRDKLIGMGYKAYIRTLRTSKGMASRVLVGPKIDKAAAAKVKRDLDKALKVDTLIKRFEP